MYKLQPNHPITGLEANCVIRTTDNAGIPFDPANTDYANFKKQILADEAQLQDADGLTLSAAEAKTYVSSLS